MKKYVTMLLALVFVFACTMTSFAAETKTEGAKTGEQMVKETQQKILDEIKSYGVTVDAGVEAAVKSLSADQLFSIDVNKEELRAIAEQTKKAVLDAAKKNDTKAIADALNVAAAKVSGYGIEVSEIKAEDITINADGTVTAKAEISYMGGTATVTVSNAKAETNPLGQKTGDNGLVIVLAGLAVVSAVLVAGMCKSRAMAL